MVAQTGRLKVLAIVLAGGEGKRLMPLTADRAKPAVPFGGIYRLIDFALSNIVNSGCLKIVVLTQYKSHSLDAHITRTWRMSTLLGNYVAPVPAQQRMGKHWFAGSADAIYQSLNLVYDEKPDIIVVVGADHVYRMDFSQMIDQHIETGAGVTVAAIRQPLSLADQFGVIEVDDADPRHIADFLEKPQNPKPLPDAPNEVLASMGNYVFNADVLEQAVRDDAADEDSAHDMGGDIVPAFVNRGEGYVYDFKDNDIPGATERDLAYWRDVGTIDSYYESHMDLVSVHPVFNLYNDRWPIYTTHGNHPPAKFVHGSQDRVGQAHGSMVSPGVVISGATVADSVVSPNVHVHSFSNVSQSVILDGVDIGRGCQIHRAIIDKAVHVPEGVSIGVDHDQDRARGFTVTDSGLVVVGKGTIIEG
ncbi:glucose-1-phosphate adenylyltransferase [Ornithinimicrobium faecis]|uniref:glucose-1-phosphate adenylyltransferase n=1 Tax=Ornithinimicrobium faecis TaxID=2934158 RepID=UPI002118272B|nr:glucose-1-phosphate adenylyltransferase [Ornithinimicrobium sp. HY1745]